jgi:hypothetical protein
MKCNFIQRSLFQRSLSPMATVNIHLLNNDLVANSASVLSNLFFGLPGNI